MERPSTFFFGLTGIGLPTSPAPGLSLSDGLRVITERNSIDRLVSSYTEFIGTVERAFLLERAQAVGYRRSRVNIDGDFVSESINGSLVRSLVEVNSWLMRLWLIKDHSVDIDAGWMAVPIGEFIQVSNNRLATTTTKADGSISITPFSRKEIEEANGISVESKYWKEEGPIALAIELDQDPEPTKLSADFLRFYRFGYLIQTGRATSDVPMKIAHWCSGLEALVSSSQTELSHQVAERTASALHAIGSNRLETFKIVKRAYGIRSKAVHGATFKEKDIAALKETAIALDDICRKLARHYLKNEAFAAAVESTQPQFDQFWLTKLLVG